MSYNKTTWKDQDVENPRTYVVRDNGDDTVTLLDAFGEVTELGTPVNAANMNHIEDGIAANDAAIATKQNTITGAASTITSSNLTASRALIANGSGKVAVSDTTSTELGYVHGVTSAIQTQLNAKATPANITSAINTLLSTLFPVGSLYITTNNSATCPLASLISGSSWSLVAADKALWTSNRNGNTTINAGLPNISGTFGSGCMMNWQDSYVSGAFYRATISQSPQNAGGTDGGVNAGIGFQASRSNSIYGNSLTVQPPAYRVNVWRRTA